MTATPRRARVLVVAGHDPSGAGVDADRDALSELAVDASFVVTARTDQDASGVRSIGAIDARAWLAEALARAHEGARVDAIKFGLLPGAEHVEAACELIRAVRPSVVVVDPVLAASSGGRFLDARGVEALRRTLLRMDVIATPNVLELAELASASGRGDTSDRGNTNASNASNVPNVPNASNAPARAAANRISKERLQSDEALDARTLARSVEARLAAGARLMANGLRGLVLKGGHGDEDPVNDLVLEREHSPVRLEHPRVVGGKVRGSGCRFASRLAGGMALGMTLTESARQAAEHVTSRIANSARR